jgi:hypothetical protein
MMQRVTCFRAGGDLAATADAIAAESAGSALTVLFASADYDLGVLGRELKVRGVGPAIGATTGRIISERGFEAAGVCGFHLPAGRFASVDAVFEDVTAIGLPELRARARELRFEIERKATGALVHRFALLLVDAESRCEERLAAVLGMELNGIPLIGGSAGDLYFNPLGHPPGSTRLLHHEGAGRGAAILCLIASASPVTAYCHNYFVHSDRKFVITDADPARRLVREIDGRPALEVYAAACGLPAQTSETHAFAPFPLMIRIGNQYYPRGMQRIYPDGALEFACALEPGLVVALGEPGDMIARFGDLLAAMRVQIGAPDLIIAFDCAARTAYMEREGLTGGIETLLRPYAVSGFASLGEQFNTVHVNNTFTCIGIAAMP